MLNKICKSHYNLLPNTNFDSLTGEKLEAGNNGKPYDGDSTEPKWRLKRVSHSKNGKQYKCLSLIIMLCLTGCMMTKPKERYSRYAVPPPNSYKQKIVKVKPNEKLNAIREHNFSTLRTDMVMNGMSMDNPMLIRVFKSEMKLELWVQSSYSDKYKLFKSYNICQKSGLLGPKQKEGDKQTPEGFYDVTPERLNPNSKYFLSFNIGFPNEYDRALGRTGSNLMIHGNCVSVGCLAMTDNNIAEIYLIIEQNFKYGHKSIPVHIYPFRMTQENMAMRKNYYWYPFWQNLKQGYDYFETYRTPAKAYTQNGYYVFN